MNEDNLVEAIDFACARASVRDRAENRIQRCLAIELACAQASFRLGTPRPTIHPLTPVRDRAATRIQRCVSLWYDRVWAAGVIQRGFRSARAVRDPMRRRRCVLSLCSYRDPMFYGLCRCPRCVVDRRDYRARRARRRARASVARAEYLSFANRIVRNWRQAHWHQLEAGRQWGAIIIQRQAWRRRYPHATHGSRCVRQYWPPTGWRHQLFARVWAARVIQRWVYAKRYRTYLLSRASSPTYSHDGSSSESSESQVTDRDSTAVDEPDHLEDDSAITIQVAFKDQFYRRQVPAVLVEVEVPEFILFRYVEKLICVQVPPHMRGHQLSVVMVPNGLERSPLWLSSWAGYPDSDGYVWMPALYRWHEVPPLPVFDPEQSVILPSSFIMFRIRRWNFGRYVTRRPFIQLPPRDGTRPCRNPGPRAFLCFQSWRRTRRLASCQLRLMQEAPAVLLLQRAARAMVARLSARYRSSGIRDYPVRPFADGAPKPWLYFPKRGSRS